MPGLSDVFGSSRRNLIMLELNVKFLPGWNSGSFYISWLLRSLNICASGNIRTPAWNRGRKWRAEVRMKSSLIGKCWNRAYDRQWSHTHTRRKLYNIITRVLCVSDSNCNLSSCYALKWRPVFIVGRNLELLLDNRGDKSPTRTAESEENRTPSLLSALEKEDSRKWFRKMKELMIIWNSLSGRQNYSPANSNSNHPDRPDEQEIDVKISRLSNNIQRKSSVVVNRFFNAALPVDTSGRRKWPKCK